MFYKWWNEKVAQKFFFSGPIVILSAICFPVTVSIMLEGRFLHVDNDF
jgi:hypothetical protein